MNYFKFKKEKTRRFVFPLGGGAVLARIQLGKTMTEKMNEIMWMNTYLASSSIEWISIAV